MDGGRAAVYLRRRPCRPERVIGALVSEKAESREDGKRRRREEEKEM
jgi:hypothetical protein